MLEAENITKRFFGITAVDGVSISVKEGETVGIIGTNGAGKTTLMNTIAGITSANGGRITLDGTDVTDTPAHKRVRLGISLVPEGRHVFPKMTVLENLKTVSNNKDDIYSVYNIFPDLERFSGKKAGTLSGGQQQMLAFSRAIIARPKLLLLDEVTMGLSPKLTEELFATIYNIGRNFSKIIITGQETQRIIDISDRIYLMKTGHILECEKENFKTEKIF